MKRYLIFVTGIQTALFLAFILFSLTFVKNVSTAEVHTVQNLAGALISELPEAESVFMQTLQNPSPEQKEAGARLLARYGYEETDFLRKSPFYRPEILTCFCAISLLFLLSLSCCFFFYHMVRRQQNTERAQLQALLERCLSDDYGFLDAPEKTSAPKQSDFPGMFPDSGRHDRPGAFPSPGQHDRPGAFPGAAQDSLSDTFLKLAKKLRLKSEALTAEKDNTKTLVTDISHQLKTPLAALKTCFQLYTEADTETEREEFGARCAFQLKKLENLTASLIHISRLENAMICLHPAPTSLTEILIEAVNAVYEKAADRKIAIETEDFQDLSLSLDQKWTAEALFNILDNAVKYSPEGSRILINVQSLYSFVRLEIEDQGIGIPRDEYNQIFKRFYRGRNETVQKSEGSGVGLYLSRKILEEQGGTLSVKAAKRRGSIFVVQFPLYQ